MCLAKFGRMGQQQHQGTIFTGVRLILMLMPTLDLAMLLPLRLLGTLLLARIPIQLPARAARLLMLAPAALILLILLITFMIFLLLSGLGSRLSGLMSKVQSSSVPKP